MFSQSVSSSSTPITVSSSGTRIFAARQVSSTCLESGSKAANRPLGFGRASSQSSKCAQIVMFFVRICMWFERVRRDILLSPY